MHKERFSFIHAADIHLDSPLHGIEQYEDAPVEEIRSATRRAFDNLISFSIDQGIDFLLIAGDLYDGDWKDYNTGLYFIQRMAKLREAEIKVYIVAGNHDAASQITKSLRLPDNVKTFSTERPQKLLIPELNVAIYGQGFPSRHVTNDLSSNYPHGNPELFNIGLLHTCLDGKPGHEPYAPCSVDGLQAKGYQYWALGHVHKREVVCEDPWIIFPGNIQGRHIREGGPKGCTLVEVDNGQISSVEHHNLDVLRWAQCKVDISTSQTLDDVYELVRENIESIRENSEGRPVALRLLLEGITNTHSALHANQEGCLQDYRALATSYRNPGVWLEKVFFKTKPSLSIEELFEKDDALGELLQTIMKLEPNENDLRNLQGEISLLLQKLPTEVFGGEDSFHLSDHETIDDIKSLLVSRLLNSLQAE